MSKLHSEGKQKNGNISMPEEGGNVGKGGGRWRESEGFLCNIKHRLPQFH